MDGGEDCNTREGQRKTETSRAVIVPKGQLYLIELFMNGMFIGSVHTLIGNIVILFYRFDCCLSEC